MIGFERSVWLIAGHWVTGRYPCRCKREKACWTSVSDPDGHPAYWCPCWGRADLDKLPAYCCAPNHPMHAGAQRTQTAPAVVESSTRTPSTEDRSGHTRQPADRPVARSDRPPQDREALPV